MGYWRAAAKWAWRDLQLSRARPAFLIAAMAVSVASIGGVRSAADVARAALHRESRSWLAGDLAAVTGEPLDEQQIAALQQMRSRGIEWTVVTTALTMGASTQSPDPSLMAVKAVDPWRYPFYGALAIEPAEALSAALRADTAILSKDALAQFHLHLGDEIRIGGTTFRVAAAIAREPDRFAGTPLNVRCLLSDQGFERSGIARSGDSIRLRILFRLPAGADWIALRQRLGELFPDADLTDFREANRDAVSILETAALFLNLTALIALTLGAMGVALAIRQHIAERTSTLAVMKMIGGRNRQLAGIFFLQIAWLAAIGFAAGLPLGWGIRAAVLTVARRYVLLPPAPLWDFAAILETAAAGLAALAPALAGTALAIGRLRPAVVLRRDFEATPPAGSRVLILAWGAPLAVLGAIAADVLGAWIPAAILVASLAASAGLAFLLVRTALAGTRRWMRAPAWRNALLWRHGVANLCRPGNRERTLIVALAIGLMMMISSFQMKGAVTRAIVDALPFDRPDMVVPIVEAGRIAAVRAFLERQPGVRKVEVGSQARGRLTTADGSHVGSMVGCAEEGAAGQAAIAANLAHRFGLRVGSQLRFAARGRVVSATVAAVRPMTRIEEIWYGVRLDCGPLDPASLLYHVTLRIAPGRIVPVRRAFLAEYPAIPVSTPGGLGGSARADERGCAVAGPPGWPGMRWHRAWPC